MGKTLTQKFKLPAFKTILIVLTVSCCAFSCTKEKAEKIGAIVDRSKIPQLHATDIVTVISDSGITRYRISTARMDVYDRAESPYWEFPKGVFVEQFDKNLKVITNMNCQYARYNKNKQLWDLRGKVKMTNVKGQLFETERLFWNERDEKFYSDTIVKITQANSIINAVSFESNQAMTQYTFRNASGPVLTNEGL